MRSRYRPATWCAAWWAVRAARKARSIATDGLHSGEVPPPPRLPEAARAGAVAGLRMMREKCLVRCLVLQRWDAAHGNPRELIIGVRPDGTASSRVRAHAWLDGDSDGYGFVELSRRPAPSD